jgi:hypothetical protein
LIWKRPTRFDLLTFCFGGERPAVGCGLGEQAADAVDHPEFLERAPTGGVAFADGKRGALDIRDAEFGPQDTPKFVEILRDSCFALTFRRRCVPHFENAVSRKGAKPPSCLLCSLRPLPVV